MGAGHHKLHHHSLIGVVKAWNGHMKVREGGEHAAQKLMHGIGAIIRRAERGDFVAWVMERRDCARNIVGASRLWMPNRLRVSAPPTTTPPPSALSQQKAPSESSR